MIVSRTCTVISQRDGERPQHGERQSRPLEEFREEPAYVLVGDPGAGKTTAFEAECEALGEQACLVTARDFLTFDPQNHPEWRGKTLYIDGLDEIRAGTSDVRTPFHEIRGRLDALGKPRFRLSCREADWLGENDRKHLESVSPDSSVTVLRLDPLTNAEVALILSARGDIQDAEAFIKTAEERGVGGLLENPQTLEMLADIVRAGEGWPESRMQTFEMACRQMVRELNDEHAAAQEPDGPPAPNQLLDAAGRLCALQLISGGSGYTLRGQPEEEYPALDQCDYDPEALRSTVFTKLFKAASNNRFSPVHRHVAEFLGARHLAGVIQDGLPARRVISMMTGEDGAVVTEMRGLSAWLAALSCQIQADLIQGDPVGVGLYGDIGQFTLDGKRALLQSLKREGARLDSVWTSAGVFGALATSEMETDLREVLLDTDRSRDHQAFTDFVLGFLGEGTPLPDIGGLLLELVRNDTRWPRVNTSALNAFIHNCSDNQDRADGLKSLLADIRAERVSDPDKELFGTLLTELYPQELPPSEIWEYLSEQGNPELRGGFRRFWETRLIEKSSDEQTAELLDHLHGRLPGLRPALHARHLAALPLKLLARGLETHGGRLEPGRLYDWLSVGSLWDEDHQTSWLGADPIRRIRDWLEKHPERRKAVYSEGLERSLESDEFGRYASNVRKRMYAASPPPDFGLWSLKQAVATSDSHPLVAEELLRWAVRAHIDQRDNEGLSLEILKRHAAKRGRLKKTLHRLLKPSPRDQLELEYLEKERAFSEERQQKEDEQLAYLRLEETALRQNRAAPALLYEIARVYFRDFTDFSTGDGPKAIARWLHGDCRLIDAALRGLRGAVRRKDLPNLPEILALRKSGRIHYLGWPFLAGLAEVERTAQEDSSQWEIGRIQRAIVLYYCTPHESYRPQWYERLLVTRPEMVAEVQVQFAISEFRSDREGIQKVWELVNDPCHAQVAKHAALPLLRAFPTRCKVGRISTLDYLLWVAIQHVDRASLLKLIRDKLTLKSMNGAQRVCWLAAGIVIAPRMYSKFLEDFSHGREARIQHLVGFFHPDGRERSSALEGIGVFGLLIRLVGRYTGPDQWLSEKESERHASKLVSKLIQNLAACPAKAASDALGGLLADPELSSWHDELSHAQDAQRVIRRDARYRHPDIEQVGRTLDGGTPANAADLTALVLDRLDELDLQIRTGNTDDWRQYWNEPHGQSPTPKHEDHCRDALLSALRQRLPERVDAQPEGQYANDKRADIRISCRDFQVPVEIKKNMHRDLWSAPRTQLIAKYTTDPATGGYGIYLVFWFGREHTQPPPSGGRPAGPEELSERLAAEANLSAVEARKISICVVDVSRPDG